MGLNLQHEMSSTERTQSTKDKQTELIGDVIAKVFDVLSERKSAITKSGKLDPIFEQNARAILAETIESLRTSRPIPVVSVDYADERLKQATGAQRAIEGQHPAESLMAAEVLFGAAMPILQDELEGLLGFSPDSLSIAQKLHHFTWRRFPAGAIAYVDALVEKHMKATLNTRKSLSRELHDRIAQGLVAARQRVELSISSNDVAAAEANLHTAISLLDEGLRDIQDIALALRQIVGGRDFLVAVEEYVESLVPSQIQVLVRSSGNPSRLSPSAAEDAFAVVVESIRNARRHAEGATEVLVDIAWQEETVLISIKDDGGGIVETNRRSGSIGLASMRERTERLAGQLTTKTGPRGTTQSLLIPLRSKPI